MDVPCRFAHKKKSGIVCKGIDKTKVADVSLREKFVSDLKIGTKEKEHTERGHERPSGFLLQKNGHRKGPSEGDHKEIDGRKDFKEGVFMGKEEVEIKSKGDTVREKRRKENGEDFFFGKVDILRKVIAVEEMRDQEDGHPKGEKKREQGIREEDDPQGDVEYGCVLRLPLHDKKDQGEEDRDPQDDIDDRVMRSISEEGVIDRDDQGQSSIKKIHDEHQKPLDGGCL